MANYDEHHELWSAIGTLETKLDGHIRDQGRLDREARAELREIIREQGQQIEAQAKQIKGLQMIAQDLAQQRWGVDDYERLLVEHEASAEQEPDSVATALSGLERADRMLSGPHATMQTLHNQRLHHVYTANHIEAIRELIGEAIDVLRAEREAE